MIYQKLTDTGWQDISFEEYKYLFNSDIKVQAVVLYAENKTKGEE